MNNGAHLCCIGRTKSEVSYTELTKGFMILRKNSMTNGQES